MAKGKIHNIEIRGARTHNLKNLDLDIPIHKITCLCGPSGSGKSSLAFYTLLLESKRRYLNSLPNDIKFFWNMPTAADVDSIFPVLPVWGLAQENPILGSRPTFSDALGLTEMVQKLYQTWGEVYCPFHKCPLSRVDELEHFYKEVHRLKALDSDILYFFTDKSTYAELFGKTFFPARSFSFEENRVHSFDEEDLYWEVFRLKNSQKEKFQKKREEARVPLDKLLFSLDSQEGLHHFPIKGSYRCPQCDFQVERVKRGLDEVSPYSASGACPECRGHGTNLNYDRAKVVKFPYLSLSEGAVSLLKSSHFSGLYPLLAKELKKRKISLDLPFSDLPQEKIWDFLENGIGTFPGLMACYDYLESKRYKRAVRIFARKLKSEVLCPLCEGTRIASQNHSLHLKDFPLSYKDFFKQNLRCLYKEVEKFEKTLGENSGALSHRLRDILRTLGVGISLGLGDIPLLRKSKSLSSSEYQRSLLTKILSYKGSGSLFVLDEPSRDLTLDEQRGLFKVLENIQAQGNTILLVEHSEYMKSQADFLISMGPGAGHKGGEILERKRQQKKNFSLKKWKEKRGEFSHYLHIKEWKRENRLFPPLKIPLGKTTVLWGDSSSLKKSYIKNFVANNLNYQIKGEPLIDMNDIEDDALMSHFEFKDLHLFDPEIGRANSRSTLGTSIGLVSELRKYFASLVVSQNLGLTPGHFSPNSELGRCPTCQGKGINEIEMSFLEDITLVCEDCEGKQLRPFIANITDGHFTIYEALNHPMGEIIPHLKLTPKYKKIWELVKILKLEYLSLNRSLTSLSGGERLRIKLLSQLSQKLENSFIIFENISAGLSKNEVEEIFDFIDSLKLHSNTLLIVDENPFVISKAEHSVFLRREISSK